MTAIAGKAIFTSDRYTIVTARRFSLRFAGRMIHPSAGSHMAEAEAHRRSLVIGVAGGSGSGKSTVAHSLVKAFDERTAVVIDCDAYYRDFSHLSAEKRSLVNWDHPDSLDLERLAADLAALAAGKRISKPRYDFVTHRRRVEVDHIAPRNVIVAEGILLFADERVRDLCDIKVFVDAEADLRLIRRIHRDMQERGRPLEEILHQYLTTVRPMHLEFVEPGKKYADVIVPQGGHNEVAVDMLVAHVLRHLQERVRS